MTERIQLENTELWINCHDHGTCIDEICCIHNRSPHHMRDWQQNWRDDIYLMERICPHGIGHPDPDDYTLISQAHKGIHGCDGCCRLL
jgi:hypothetical protein